jgi:SAM-dependent methyltransferase
MSYKSFIHMIEPLVGGLRGKRVLDVGCDWAARLIQELVTDFGAAEAIGINLIAEDRQYLPQARTMCADVTKLPFPDGYFDVIISSSAFEHIRGLDRGLVEMHRVLKKGGSLYAQFGPIWSTCYGHHIWFNHGGREYTYHNVLLPPWCHLLLEPSELKAQLKNIAEASLVDAIVEWVYHSDGQNRLFFEDYETIFQESPFRTLFLKGYDFDDLARKYEPLMDAGIFDRLHSRYPRNGNWRYDGMTALVRRD